MISYPLTFALHQRKRQTAVHRPNIIFLFHIPFPSPSHYHKSHRIAAICELCRESECLKPQRRTELLYFPIIHIHPSIHILLVCPFPRRLSGFEHKLTNFPRRRKQKTIQNPKTILFLFHITSTSHPQTLIAHLCSFRRRGRPKTAISSDGHALLLCTTLSWH